MVLAAVVAVCEEGCWQSLPARPPQESHATLAVNSSPTGAKVYVDGYFRGRTPVETQVAMTGQAAQKCTVTVIAPGRRIWRGSVTLVPGAFRSLRLSLEPLQNPRVVVCVDPGHPSEAGIGTRGLSGLTENRVNWLIARKLRESLLAEGWQVVLTKSSEGEYVGNRRTAEIANQAGAALMLRLHCDAGKASGFAVYYPDRQGEKSGYRGPTQEVISASRSIARSFYAAAVSALRGRLAGLGVHGDSATAIGSRQGALTGSIFSHVPILTVEMCVLTNPHDETFIASQQGQRLMTEALLEGLRASVGR